MKTRFAQSRSGDSRKGVVLIFTAVILVVLLAMVAYSVDIGYISLVRTQLQRTADAAAHAAILNVADPAVGITQAVEMGDFNTVNQQAVTLEATDITYGIRNLDRTIQWYGPGEVPADSPISCARARARMTAGSPNGALGLFFAPVLGVPEIDVEAESIAAIAPRDIVFVIDLSGSMHHDTEPGHYKAVNFASPGAGDLVMDQVLEDMGLDDDMSWPFPDKGEGGYGDRSWDSANKANNKATTWFTNSGTQTTAQLDYTTIFNKLSQVPFVRVLSNGNKVPNNNVTVTTKNGETRTLGSYAVNFYGYNSNSHGTAQANTYDYITDFVLPEIMPDAKPALGSANYEYWRGYQNYARQGSPGSGLSSGGINSYANPTTSTQANSSAKLYVNAAGQQYNASTLMADAQALRNEMGYRTYIQMMMDLGYNSKVGMKKNGSLSKFKYTPMSRRADSGDAYGYTDGEGFFRTIREMPGSAVIDALIAGIRYIRDENEGVPEDIKDMIAVLAFYGQFHAVTDAFTTEYDAVIGDVLENCSQSMPNGSSNMDQVGGSWASGGTCTQWGLREARQWMEENSRDFTEKWVILFTDGVPNVVEGDFNTNNNFNVEMQDGSTQPFFYSSGSDLDAKNGALYEGLQLKNLGCKVHTVCCGNGADLTFTEKMASGTGGKFISTGSDPLQYISALTAAFEQLAQLRVVRFVFDANNPHHASN